MVTDILARMLPGVRVWAFGSRATGKAKQFSDLDLAVEADAPLDLRTLALLDNAFAESDLPIKVDVIDLRTVSPSFRVIVERDRVEVV